MKKQIAIQMDNIESIDYNFDTSFLIGYEAQLRNYKIFYYNPKDLIIKNGNVQATGYYLKLNLDPDNYFKYASDKITLDLKYFNFIFLRQDPPFDMNYITSTYILDFLPHTTKVINNPTAVRNATEKLYTFNYYDLLAFTKRIEDKYQNIMLISHNPSIQNFCLEYVKNQKSNQDFENLKQKFPTCAVAILSSSAKNWSSIDKKGFELKKFIIPKSISD